MHRITPILFIYWPHYILYSILYCIIYWPHCPAEDVVVFFGIISGFYVHQQNRTNFPLRCPFLLFSLSSLLFPFWWFCNGIRRIAQIGHWAVDPGALLRSKCTKPRFSVYCPLKNPVDPLSFNSIGTQCTLDYLKYVFFYILFQPNICRTTFVNLLLKLGRFHLSFCGMFVVCAAMPQIPSNHRII